MCCKEGFSVQENFLLRFSVVWFHFLKGFLMSIDVSDFTSADRMNLRGCGMTEDNIMAVFGRAYGTNHLDEIRQKEFLVAQQDH